MRFIFWSAHNGSHVFPLDTNGTTLLLGITSCGSMLCG